MYATSILGNAPLSIRTLFGPLVGASTTRLQRLAAFAHVSPAQAHPMQLRASHIACYNIYFLSVAAASLEEKSGACADLAGAKERCCWSWHGHMHAGASDAALRERMPELDLADSVMDVQLTVHQVGPRHRCSTRCARCTRHTCYVCHTRHTRGARCTRYIRDDAAAPLCT